MRAPSEDLMEVLANASDVALTVKVDLFVGRMPAAPDQCVSIKDTGGPAPEANIRSLYPSAQILVRGSKGADYRVPYALAQTIRDVLIPPGPDGQPMTCRLVIGGSRYISVAVQSDVFYLGNDDSDRPLFSLNLRMHRTEATT